jgi:hypothetical protein
MSRDLAGELLEALDGWQGQQVAVRVVANRAELIAVFAGTLQARSAAKGASLFWPVALDGPASGRLELPGIYARPELLSDVRLHAGGFVVEYAQAGVTVNVRRLGGP